MHSFRRPFITALLLMLIHVLGVALPAAVADKPRTTSESRTNVVFILIDDLGWTDLGCFGSDLYESPHIDQLARDGMLFRQAYSACTVCSPTRAALMTGKYPARLHVTDWIPGEMPENPRMIVPDWTKHLPLEEITLAEVFRSAGYATASIGKWHLGDAEFYPEQHGFDLNIAGTSLPNTKRYFAPWNIPTISEGAPNEYITDRLGAEAERFIREQGEHPFFLYLAHFGVHTPIQGPESLVQKYSAVDRSHRRHRNAGYAAMIESVDATVGRVRDTLRELKLDDHTLIVVTSDNGGRIPTTSNAPLRAGKGSAYEGGVRVPLIVFAPGVTAPASTSDAVVMTIDFFPTLLELTGLPLPPELHPDGQSLVRVLRGEGPLDRDAIYWHYPHHQHYQLEGAMPYSAMRSGSHRLIEFFDDGRLELYDLADDVGEQRDLASLLPDKTRELHQQLSAWRAAVGAQLPTPNPAYDPTRPQHTAQ